MSVGRDVIASVCNCAEEDVKCENCFRFDGDRIFNCAFWDQHTKLDSFCSFFSLRGGGDETGKDNTQPDKV